MRSRLSRLVRPAVPLLAAAFGAGLGLLAPSGGGVALAAACNPGRPYTPGSWHDGALTNGPVEGVASNIKEEDSYVYPSPSRIGASWVMLNQGQAAWAQTGFIKGYDANGNVYRYVFVQWKQPTDRHPTTFKAANQQPVGATSNYAVLWSPAASGYFNTYLDGSQSAGPIPFSVSPDTAAVVGEVNDAASQMPGDPFGDAEVFTDAEISYTEGPPSTKR